MIKILNDSSELAKEKIGKALKKKGFGLESYFYSSEVIYETEIQEILLRSWLYAGHISQVAHKGDYITLNIDHESFIVINGDDHKIRAFANTCRHRGARICQGSGNATSLICPYHAWVYNINGKLTGARYMGEDFDKSEYGLKEIGIYIFHGLIFVNADTDAAHAKKSFEAINTQLAPYKLHTAKIAAQKTYTVDANWKLALENYLECYHCGPSHKEYAKSHSLKDEAGRVATLNIAMKKRALEQFPFDSEFVESVTSQYGSSDARGCDVSHMRYALFDGYQTGSIDGNPVAPLMGDFNGYDGGAGDFQLGPLTFMLNYPDHCVLYRFLPSRHDQTEMELVWFVNKEAVEGFDYDIERLTELWDKTTLEDKKIIMQNSKGVNSRHYEPGPYSPVFENLCINFINWYLNILSESPELSKG